MPFSSLSSSQISIELCPCLQRIYVAYNTFFIIGLLCSMQIPFVGFQPVKTSEHMASAGKSSFWKSHRSTG